MQIRPIENKDNIQIAQLIRSILEEFDVPKVGTAYADPELDFMYETYSKPQSMYFVIENDGEIVGGGGIASLLNEDVTICELQKMYFMPQIRGLGWGKKLIDLCILNAKEMGFKKCYLETLPNMELAQKLYKKSGFTYLNSSMGCTGHSSCSVWMIKEI